MFHLAHHFDLTRLNAFAATAEEGSITAAAARLGVAQPALSASIRRLEADLGQKLFDRLPRGVALTRAGALLLPRVYEIFGSLEQVREELAETARTPRGEVSIGMPPSAATVMLQPVLRTLTEAYPQVAIRAVEAMSGYLHQWVEDGDLDMAITFNNADTRTLLSRRLFPEEVMLIGTPHHIDPLPDPTPVTRLPELPLILTSARHTLRALLDQQVTAIGLKLNIRYEIDAGHELVRLVSRGEGCGVFARSAFAEELALGKVRARALTPPYSRMVCLTRHRRGKSDRLISTIAEAVEARCLELRAEGVWPE